MLSSARGDLMGRLLTLLGKRNKLVCGAVAAAFSAMHPGLAEACTISASIATDLGSYSPSAVKAAAVPALRSRAGLSCSPGVLMLLSGNYIRATYQSRSALKLVQVGGAGAAVPYVLSADPNGTVVAPQNGTIDYMQNNLLNLLGLLGGSSADLPFYVRPSATLPIVEGVYTDRITIKWDWYLCQGVGALGLCLLGADSGTATTVVDVVLTVAAKRLSVALTSATTWDPVNGSRFPKALPGSKRRISVSITNPDIVETDSPVTVVVPLPAGQAFAPDGDGMAGGPVVALSSSSACAPQTLSYVGPASEADDVDFSADAGLTWTHVPTSTDGASNTTAIRLRPQGKVPAGATISISFPASVR